MYSSVPGLYPQNASSASSVSPCCNSYNGRRGLGALENSVVPGREPLVWTEGRVVGATELIIAPTPLNPEFEI